jgi:hypothetical protein
MRLDQNFNKFLLSDVAGSSVRPFVILMICLLHFVCNNMSKFHPMILIPQPIMAINKVM